MLIEGSSTNLLKDESGGHRWQRISPTERRGRVHTSTVTVAIFEITQKVYSLRDSDIEVIITKDSGPGGQHRNKTESCVIMRHKPTKLEAKSALKHQHRNRELARILLESRVQEYYKNKDKINENNNRREQIGSGMRGDKIKTYRERDNIVIDHRTNNKLRLDGVLAGKI